MMRSLYAGVSGLKTHQTKMDIIGNNIANVNTVAYKSMSATFSELMYQTTQAASGANAETGRAGINAKQIGLGVKSGAINTAITTEGATQNTGNPFDVQLNGDSFFIVSDGSNTFFTRAGTFNIDANGTLCMTTNGYTVQGWQADAEGNIIKNTVSPLRVMSDENQISDPEATTDGYMTGIIDKNDDQLSGTGQVTTLQVYDSKGYSYTVKFKIFNTDSDGNELEEGKYRMIASDILDADGNSIFTSEVLSNVGAASAEEYLASENIMGGSDSQTLTYNTKTGAWAGGTGFTLNLASIAGDVNDAFTSNVTVDMTSTKNIDNSGISTINGNSGKLTNKAVGAGHAAGTMSALSIDQAGKIIATYTNGVTKTMGQIAVATFSNAAGLQKEGENLYSATQNSGEFDGIGVDVTADGGSMSSGVLEMSNVDLSTEFTDMIVTQRGFQANSRIITVSDSMLEELINLKR